jgi:hypothetical protein
MTFYNSEAIRTSSHTNKIESSNKDNKILFKKTLHDVQICILAGVYFADSIVSWFKKLLASDIKVSAY